MVKDVNSNDAQLFAGSYAPVKVSKLNQCGAEKERKVFKKETTKRKKAMKKKARKSKKATKKSC